MIESPLSLAILLLVAGGTGWVLWRNLCTREMDEAGLRERALKQFRVTRAAFPAFGLEFDGRVAEVMGSHETKFLASLVASNYVLTINARMPDGVEYDFKSDSNGKPWVICRSRGDAHAVRTQADF